jgi:hypothetical protein
MLRVRQRKGVALRASHYVRAKALTFHQRAWRFAPSYFRRAEALRFHLRERRTDRSVCATAAQRKALCTPKSLTPWRRGELHKTKSARLREVNWVQVAK